MELSNTNETRFLLVIVGPTAVGKSELAVEIAEYFKSTVISADSRQFYKELNIGTAKPSPDTMRNVPHLFINSHSITEFYSAGAFERDALEALDLVFKKSSSAILVGGSGMYIDAVCKGFNEVPEVPQRIRENFNRLNEEYGLEKLAQQLKDRDPDYYARVDISNPQRVIRALEVIEYTGKKFSALLGEKSVSRPFNMIKVGLIMDRESLYQRINERMDDMISDGLFEEAAGLYHLRDLYALQTVGYKEIFDFMDGLYDKPEAIRLLKRNSRRYAKRQLTWFRKDPDINWFEPGKTRDVIAYLEKEIRAKTP